MKYYTGHLLVDMKSWISAVLRGQAMIRFLARPMKNMDFHAARISVMKAGSVTAQAKTRTREYMAIVQQEYDRAQNRRRKGNHADRGFALTGDIEIQ